MDEVKVVKQLRPIRNYSFNGGFIIRSGKKKLLEKYIHLFSYPSRDNSQNPREEKQLLKEYVRKFGQPKDIYYSPPYVSLIKKGDNYFNFSLSHPRILMNGDTFIRVETCGNMENLCMRFHHSKGYITQETKDNRNTLSLKQFIHLVNPNSLLTHKDLQMIVKQLDFKCFSNCDFNPFILKRAIEAMMGDENYYFDVNKFNLINI